MKSIASISINTDFALGSLVLRSDYRVQLNLELV